MTIDELQPRLGRVIRYHRERKGFSQEGFSDLIDVHQTYYGAVERGRQNVTLRRLKLIADGLEMPVWKLLHEAETKQPTDFPEPRKPGRPPGNKRLR
ncbi:MAG: helix-turn-helix transcriptional regulator [Proteobacteria bacterium]|jgi:transcriptional regulator with XRE-family HTH domain|nr:helix-turn-helix transcriptional regulator [Pseudomonadota bacterium]